MTILRAAACLSPANKCSHGTLITKDNKIWEVKGSAPVTVGRMTYIQLDLRDIASGTAVPTRFRMTEDLELAPLDDPEPFSFLYTADSGNTFVFMHQTTFEQVLGCKSCYDWLDVLSSPSGLSLLLSPD